MIRSFQFSFFLVFGIFSTLVCSGQAPATLPACIVKYETRDSGNSNSTQIPSAPNRNTRTVLYRSDSTYSEWAITYSGPDGSGALVPHQGTFTYSVDPADPTHATIIYDGGAGSVPTDDLYFVGSDGGYHGVPPATNTTIGTSVSIFRLYSAQAASGGANLSTRATLTAGGTTIAGFVVGGTRPRWVLLRAVGASLQQFGVSATVTSPSFTLWNAKHEQVGASSVWSADPNLVPGFTSAFSLVGAFPLTAGSDEGVLLLPLNPGAYTIVLSGKSAGDIMGEVYFLPY